MEFNDNFTWTEDHFTEIEENTTLELEDDLTYGSDNSQHRDSSGSGDYLVY